MAGPLRDDRGLGLIDAVAAVAVMALVALSLFQLQVLVTETNRGSMEHTDVHRALRQFLWWVEGDAAVACAAAIDGGTLTLRAVFGQEKRQVRYLADGEALMRVLYKVENGTETELRRSEVARPLQVQWGPYDGSTGLLRYRVESHSRHQRAELRHDGAVWLRGSAAGGC